MDNLLLFLIGIVLIIICIQDLKKRLISLFLLIFLFIICLIYWYYNSYNFLQLLYNISFILVNLTLLKMYTLIAKKEKTDDLIPGLGLGDVLFFIVITPLFSTVNFILFFISGLFVSMLAHLFMSFFNKNKFIPLAGYLALYLIGFTLYLKITDKSFYLDLITLNY